MLPLSPVFTGARAAQLAPLISEWKSRSPGLGVFVLLPESERARIPEIQAAFRAQGVPLVGAVFPSLIDGEAFSSEGACLIPLDPMPPWFLIDRISSGPRTAHSRIGDAISEGLAARNRAEPPTLFLVFDAMIGRIGSILGAVHRRHPRRVRWAGVNAGSETFQPIDCLFDADRLVGDGVLGLLLDTPEFAIRHEYPVGETLMQATSTKGNRIRTIDGRPAFEVYQEVIRREFGVGLTHENFYDFAVHFPFALVTLTDVVVRIPVGFDDEGAIACVGECPPNSLLRLIRAPALDDSTCVQSLSRTLGASRHPAEAMLTFYCAGRRMHFGDDATEELRRLRAAAGATRLAGALSLGEIATRDDGSGGPAFHNAALVCL